MRRGHQFVRDQPLVVWLVAALIVAITHRWVPEATWLLIHLVMLGAVSHAVLIWSGHFSRALLRSRDNEADQRVERVRLVSFALGAAGVFVGVPLGWWPLVVAGAAVAVAVVVWHAITMLRARRRALGGRFGITIGYYVAAACCMPLGAAGGVVLARGLGETWHPRVLVAHSLIMLLGWLGLTVVGTLVTFWPTVLRSRMDDRSARLARQSLPILLVGLAVVVTGALLGLTLVTVAGMLGYAVGLGWVGRSFWAPLRRRPPREFASASILAGACWFVIALVATAITVAVLPPADLVGAYPTLAAMWVVGFGLQIVPGALSHLVPAVVGGGPSVVRVTTGWFNRGAAFRLTLVNGGLVIFLLPVGGWVRVLAAAAVAATVAAFLVLMPIAVVAGARAKRAQTPGERRTERVEWRPSLGSQGWLAGLVTLALLVSVGAAVSAPSPSAGGSAVAPSGRTVTVEVEANQDMRFVPDHVRVGRGDRVVITVTNVDPTTTHDLRLGDQQTKRLGPGEHDQLVLDAVGASIEGWCTVVGHRAMGMTFSVIVDDEPVAPDTASSADRPVHPIGDTPLTRTVDPILAPATDQHVHRVELRVRVETLEVAPGVWQRRWTYNGAPVGPTLRGKVGDVFEVTMINETDMGHSLDFHSSALAPDGPMRTVPPGESLTYRFTAKRAGAWLYHCGTEPMSAHIAAGLHGAVIIDPPDLPAVDREYVLVQSEIHLDPNADASDPAQAGEVDAAAAMAGSAPDFVVFNGIAAQYRQRPLTAKAGERVRIWIVDAGPNRATSLHVIGGQFDTVFREGGYLLQRGRDPFGTRSGGAQALALQPAQGGFVELVFPEAGHYPVVSHVMTDAERGAAGIFDVGQ